MSNIDEKAKNNFTIEMRIFENYEKVKHEIIKVIDFLEHSGTYGEYHTIRGNRWLKTPIDKIDRENRICGYWFPYYKNYIPHRIKVLKLALKDLERIKEEYGKD